MRTEISYSPAFAMATVHLDVGESVKAEAGAMMAMTPSVEIHTSTKGGVLKGSEASVLGGESFFMNTFTATGPDAARGRGAGAAGRHRHLVAERQHRVPAVRLVPGVARGDRRRQQVGRRQDVLQPGRALHAEVHGLGDLVVSSYGAIQAIDLPPGQSYIVDTGHMVGWDEGVSYEVQKAGSWKSTMLGGEGLVVRLTGPGRVYVQTRSPDGFLDWLIPKLPTQRS